MGIDRKYLQIARIKATHTDGSITVVEAPVPSFGPTENIISVVVEGLSKPLRLGGDVHGIVGATLSARATTRGVRRALALYEVVVQNGR